MIDAGRVNKGHGHTSETPPSLFFTGPYATSPLQPRHLGKTSIERGYSKSRGTTLDQIAHNDRTLHPGTHCTQGTSNMLPEALCARTVTGVPNLGVKNP